MKEFDTRPWLILCEGETDRVFLNRLIKQRDIPDKFQVQFPSRGDDNIGGRSKFARWLSLVADSESFRQNIEAVLIVSDNDLSPASSLAEVTKALKEAGFPVPTKERVVAKKSDYPAVCILMIPAAAPGDLETLCLQAAYEKWKISAAIDAFTAATPAKDWSANKLSKMKLQALLAATCEPSPGAGFAGHWRENEKYHIPLESAAFNDIADFLILFDVLISES